MKKFRVGDRVYYNDPEATIHGITGEIRELHPRERYKVVWDSGQGPMDPWWGIDHESNLEFEIVEDDTCEIPL